MAQPPLGHPSDLPHGVVPVTTTTYALNADPLADPAAMPKPDTVPPEGLRVVSVVTTYHRPHVTRTYDSAGRHTWVSTRLDLDPVPPG